MSDRSKELRDHLVHDVHFVVDLWLLCIGFEAAARPLGEFTYRLYGLTLDVSPAALTVPRGVSSQLKTAVTDAASLDGDASVQAMLRGPSLSQSAELIATPGEPIFLPTFSQPGTHFLENTRLELEPGVSSPAAPSSVTINVLDELLVSEVTSRPLSLKEIERLGIEFDENRSQAFSFTIAFSTESEVVEFDIPVFAPINVMAEDGTMLAPRIATRDLAELEGLKPPDLSIEPVMLEIISQDLPEGGEIPSTPDIVVIPGNVAFLNHFFDVMLMVSNQAPDGTPLFVTNLKLEFKFPAGGNQLPGGITANLPFTLVDAEFENSLVAANLFTVALASLALSGRQLLELSSLHTYVGSTPKKPEPERNVRACTLENGYFWTTPPPYLRTLGA